MEVFLMKGALLLCLAAFPFWLVRETQMSEQDPGLELDHFFVAVTDSAAGAAALESRGFEVGLSHPHAGQGTASRGVIFENVYLELIWLTDTAEARSAPIRRTRLADRLRSGSGACPFGLGLRRTAETDPDLPFDTWAYSPPYLPEGASFQMAASSEVLAEPLVFYLPWALGRALPPPEHPNGARSVTGLEIFLTEGSSGSETMAAVSGAGLVSFRQGDAFQMVVELDHGEAGKSLDLRPEIPLLIQW
jgi:hypothetical protein